MLKVLEPNFLCLVGLVVMMLLAGGSGDSGTSVTPTSPAPTGGMPGSQSMPDTDELRQKAEQAKQEIAGIDAKMKSGQ
ncbi:MAG TPA: hypothetical protein VKX39_05860 [Bryobacteraceae bacterium]|jgi:hypothetical protein|nr:hypothetical protein [Bryobacteraceae bacterium]